MDILPMTWAPVSMVASILIWWEQKMICLNEPFSLSVDNHAAPVYASDVLLTAIGTIEKCSHTYTDVSLATCFETMMCVTKRVWLIKVTHFRRVAPNTNGLLLRVIARRHEV